MRIPREIKVALMGIGAIVLAVIGWNYLKGRKLLESTNIFHAVYKDIDGLSLGSKVLYRGKQFGQVEAIDYIPEQDRIGVSFSVQSDKKVPRDSRAMIVSLDFLGAKGLVLVMGESDQYAEYGDTLQDSLQLGLTKQLTEELMPLKSKLEGLTEEITALTLKLNATLRDTAALQQTVGSIAATMQNVERSSQSLPPMMDELRQSNRQVQNILRNLEKQDTTITNILQNTESLTATLDRQAGPLASNLRSSTARLDSILLGIERGEGTAGKLLKDSTLYYRLDELVKDLDNLVVDVTNYPGRYLKLSVFDFNRTPKERKLKYED